MSDSLVYILSIVVALFVGGALVASQWPVATTRFVMKMKAKFDAFVDTSKGFRN